LLLVAAVVVTMSSLWAVSVLAAESDHPKRDTLAQADKVGRVAAHGLCGGAASCERAQAHESAPVVHRRGPAQ
jgi:hypothetical protein